MFSDYTILQQFIGLVAFFAMVVVVGIPILTLFDVIKGWIKK